MLDNHTRRHFKDELFNISDDILDDVLDYIRRHSNQITPDEVFDETDLTEWALNNGFTREK
jgi:hypothetical protein